MTPWTPASKCVREEMTLPVKIMPDVNLGPVLTTKMNLHIPRCRLMTSLDGLAIGVLFIQSLLWLSERLQWFTLNHYGAVMR